MVFSFIKKKLQKIYNAVSSKLGSLFATQTVDSETLDQLERILIEADTGVHTTRKLIAELRDEVKRGQIEQGTDLHRALEQKLQALLEKNSYNADAQVILLVGINGSGKTTTAAKLADSFKQKGKNVLLVAADTFRAAAVAQLQTWADRIGVPVVKGKEQQDPASVVFAGCEEFKNKGYDVLIVDTAGRLQTKTNLMKELEKIGKIVSRQLPGTSATTLLTIDAMLGQNSLDQAQLFNESTKLNGIVLTKLDGTGKGGIVFSITNELNVPVAYITFGEQIDQIKRFDAHDYVAELLGS